MSASAVVQEWVDRTSGLRCAVVVSPEGAPLCLVAVGPEHPWHQRRHDGELCGHPGCRDHTLRSAIDVDAPLRYSGPAVPGMPQRDDEWWFGVDASEPVGADRSEGDDEAARCTCATLARQLALGGLAWGMF